MKIFALGPDRAYGERVSAALDVPLSPLEEQRFADGERKCRPAANVRNEHVFVLTSLYADERSSVHDKLCEVLFFIGALKDAAAATVTAVVPYLCYARSDRKTSARDPVTTRYVASLFEAVGTDRVVAMDVHNLMAYQNAFRCRTEHLEATQLFVRFFAAAAGPDDVTVVAPDPGGVGRAERFERALARRLQRDVGTAFVEKYRGAEGLGGRSLIGDVANRTAIVVDDLVATGTTLARAAQVCRDRGARVVYTAATHGLFVGDAPALLAGAPIDRIVVTDTVPPFRLPASLVDRKVSVLDTTPFVAEAIRRIDAGTSLSALVEGTDHAAAGLA